ncbi:21658_t:CDS:10 [Cetraspora pellucida]|uniref:21658_t:CDS:1 n=1 Tax=Cetraspora pellucida TaxID=1433469 RepID=A0A9N9E1U1_9GLOM|nr:21658_t:CDS:10 [Cetraspora pellucida]
MVPYSLPIIGHTIPYIIDAGKFLAECRKKYGDPFSIYVFGNVVTYAGHKTSFEIYKEHDIFDHDSILAETLIFPLAFKKAKGFDNLRFLANAVHEQISEKVKVFLPRMHKEIKRGIDLYIGDCKEPKVFNNLGNTTISVMVRPMCNIIIGEEACQFEELVTSITTLLRQLGVLPLIPQVLSLIYPKLQLKAISLFLKFVWNPIDKPKKLFIKLMKPIVKERIFQKEKLGNKYIMKDDLMEYYLIKSDSAPNNVNDVNDEYMEYLFEQMTIAFFAAFFTTVKVVTEAIYEYGGRPELWKDIYEEQLMVYNQKNGNLTIDDVHKMVKLDGLVKESLRQSFPKGDSYTFNTGATIPKGRKVAVYAADSHFNPEYFENPEMFQPNRYLTLNSDGSVLNYTSAAKLEKYYVPFGAGKHACPGRILAVTELKLCLHELILKYHIKTKSGKVDPRWKLSDFWLAPITDLVFENRKN